MLESSQYWFQQFTSQAIIPRSTVTIALNTHTNVCSCQKKIHLHTGLYISKTRTSSTTKKIQNDTGKQTELRHEKFTYFLSYLLNRLFLQFVWRNRSHVCQCIGIIAFSKVEFHILQGLALCQVVIIGICQERISHSTNQSLRKPMENVERGHVTRTGSGSESSHGGNETVAKHKR